jgi:hypothetical protein
MSLFSRLALVAQAEMEVDRTHTEGSSAGQKQDVELPEETNEEEGREGAGWIKSKQRERLGKRSSQTELHPPKKKFYAGKPVVYYAYHTGGGS